ncbi:N-acetyl-anhydromuranmyl-L-alanine amidase [Thiomicrorhabdus immobilis]|uniref:1,6-anhydro-N-acetylmuramyl-L-alanine amidase AmpD n=1 Tax=Thiomicrorhabdus immobilis TaxID=2791037 RepID=A0ABN6CWV9_9GAMM|nr:1,6-anhydro-N-acetylmuramyl-L-alanine amidase AmpD [Thiomicrorhabdus immobilis]BCN93538.1 N-acetyl-anhydromuranmyl-L-alanine amidase [Thiomicrorhabdus immobilis]
MQNNSLNSFQTLKLRVDNQTGLIEGGQFIESPNQDLRPNDELPGLVVVHGISLPPNQFGGEGITQLFTNTLNPKEHPYYQTIQHLTVSAHALIRRDGQIIQYVPFHKRAWHAGLSEYEGRERCNDFSIGIELEGTDSTCYTASQYHALAGLIKALWQAYPSLKDRKVVGHSDIAPGRKTDPGDYFLWSSLNRLTETEA